MTLLHSDMINQMSNMEESWRDIINSQEWCQGYGLREKKLLAQAMQDSRSWGNKALRKFKELKKNYL